MSSSSNSTPSTIIPSLSVLHTSHTIPPSLKFLIQSLKVIVTILLTPENYLLWKSQVIKLFTANSYFGYLDGSIPQPSAFLPTIDNLLSPNPDASLWILINHNLSTVLLSTISLPILPHLQDLPTCHEIWLTIHHRLQPTNRSSLNKLHLNKLFSPVIFPSTLNGSSTLTPPHISPLTFATSTTLNLTSVSNKSP